MPPDACPSATPDRLATQQVARRSDDRDLAGDAWRRIGNPVILPVTRFVYGRLADVLFAWNK
jgi:hypothetical protein